MLALVQARARAVENKHEEVFRWSKPFQEAEPRPSEPRILCFCAKIDAKLWCLLYISMRYFTICNNRTHSPIETNTQKVSRDPKKVLDTSQELVKVHPMGY